MSDLQEMSLPDYDVRISRRARHARIRVTPLGQVEVVIPFGFDPAEVPRLLAKRRAWLSKTLQNISQRHQTTPDTHGLRPLRIDLHAIGESWLVDYATGLRRKLLESRPASRLTVAGDNTPQQISRYLRDWLQNRAREVLPSWMQQTSEEVGLPFNGISIRGQKTRWGSCSARRHISLNRSLLLLPEDTVHYLFIHELCHTRHLNHSCHFWQEVKKHAPDFQKHETVLRKAARTLPLWVYT